MCVLASAGRPAPLPYDSIGAWLETGKPGVASAPPAVWAK